MNSRSGGGHSEVQLIAWARKQGVPQCGWVEWLFTERQPCPSCDAAIAELKTELGSKQPENSVIDLIYLVTFKPDLAAPEHHGEDVLWDLWLLSDGEESYENLRLFRLNKQNYKFSEWTDHG